MTLTTVIDNGRMTAEGVRMALHRITARMADIRLTIPAEQSFRVPISDLALEIHTRNQQAGWWSDLITGRPIQRNVGELLMLMVSEIAEIPPLADWQTERDDKLPHRLMVEVELADCAIRIFDTAGANAPLTWQGFMHEFISDGVAPPLETWPAQIDGFHMVIVRNLAAAMEGHRKGRLYERDGNGDKISPIPAFDYHLGAALFYIFNVAIRLNLDIAGAISEKLAFNATREDHKPAARAGDNGKKY